MSDEAAAASAQTTDSVEDPGRRRFILRAIAAIGGLIAGGLAIPTLGFGTAAGWRATSPLRLLGRSVPPTLRGEGFVPAGALADFAVGSPRRVALVRPVVDAWVGQDAPIAAFVLRRADRDVVAFDTHCTHLGCPLAYVEGARRFLCPCHGGVFDREGNAVSGPPPRPMYQLQTRLDGDQVLIGPLVEG